MSAIGQALQESLKEVFPDHEHEAVLLHFDRTMTNALSSWVETGAAIKGTAEFYRGYAGIWTVGLKNVEVRLSTGTVIASAERTTVYSVARQ